MGKVFKIIHQRPKTKDQTYCQDQHPLTPNLMSAYTIKLNHFQGPLDLLLSLIQKQQLDIAQVSLAQVADQYIEHLKKFESHLNPDELADFLVVATRLLFIKSKTLLPQVSFDEEETGDLERQLKMYKAFLEAVKRLEGIISQNNFCFSRESLSRNLAGTFIAPKRVDQKVLFQVFREVVAGLEIIPKLKERRLEKAISIQEKISQIKILIGQKTELGFKELIIASKDRVEVIVSFLALLELVKQRTVVLIQEDWFGEIIVRSN